MVVVLEVVQTVALDGMVDQYGQTEVVDQVTERDLPSSRVDGCQLDWVVVQPDGLVH